MRSRFSFAPWVALIFSGMDGICSPLAADTGRLDYGRDIRPILSDKMLPVPWPGQARSAWPTCVLDSFEGATADRGGAVRFWCRASLKPVCSYQRHHGGTAGDANAARVFEPRATPEQIAILKRWIAEGGHTQSTGPFTPRRCDRDCLRLRASPGSSNLSMVRAETASKLRG